MRAFRSTEPSLPGAPPDAAIAPRRRERLLGSEVLDWPCLRKQSTFPCRGGSWWRPSRCPFVAASSRASSARALTCAHLSARSHLSIVSRSWYQYLRKPKWAPAPWAFGPVWSALVRRRSPFRPALTARSVHQHGHRLLPGLPTGRRAGQPRPDTLRTRGRCGHADPYRRARICSLTSLGTPHSSPLRR